MWAFSKLEILDEELFTAIAGEAMGKLPRFNAQNVANTVSIYPLKCSRLTRLCFACCWGLDTQAGK